MGVEPIRVSSKDFESFVSTCFTTEAYKNFKKKTVEVLLAGYAGFEPAESRSQGPLPYHLANTQQLMIFIMTD